MTASTSRILSCRRRSRIHPNSDMQATKPKTAIAFKPRMDPQENLPVLSENVSQWPSIKATRTASLDSDCEEKPSIFRQRTDVGEQEQMFALKRANPVYDSEDEEDLSYCSPSKRQRTIQTLQWGDRFSNENEVISFPL